MKKNNQLLLQLSVLFILWIILIAVVIYRFKILPEKRRAQRDKEIEEAISIDAEKLIKKEIDNLSPEKFLKPDDSKTFPDQKNLDDAIKLAGNYMVRSCDKDGKFVYSVNIKSGIRITGKYNMLRHAGAIYALTMYGEAYPDKNIKSAILRAVKFLETHAIAPVQGEKDMLAVWSKQEVTGRRAPLTAKLGGAGLGLVALTSADKLIPGTTSLEMMKQLGDFIRFMQKPDGSFYSKYIPDTGGKDATWNSLYYPGEAALGLLMLYEKDPDPQWLESAANAIGFLARKRSGRREVEVDHWALLATAKLLPLYDRLKTPPVSRELILHHGIKICKSILNEKTGFTVLDPGFGSFLKDARTCPTSIRLEGLLAALKFIPKNQALLRKIICSRINQGMMFILRSQIKTGEFSGGFPGALRRFSDNHPIYRKKLIKHTTEIRIDYVQHALSAMLEYKQTFYKNIVAGKGDDRQVIKNISATGTVSLKDYPLWLSRYVDSFHWHTLDHKKKLNAQILKDSFKLGKQFIINNQKPAGNFNYEYNFITHKFTSGDNQVRQAGALWGVALMFDYESQTETRDALDRGLKFFFTITREKKGDGGLFIEYPGDSVCKSGTVALVALSIIEYLRTDRSGKVKLTEDYRSMLEIKLKGYLKFLQSLLLDNGHFSGRYSYKDGKTSKTFDPYSEGEILLCLIKAAKYLGYSELIPLVEKVSLPLAKYYTVDQWKNNYDSPLTKGFFQWSCMAFAEYQQTNWKNAQVFGDYLIAISWWMIYVHQTLHRTRNTGYVYEGIINAWQFTERSGKDKAAQVLGYVIDRGLFKLTTWQVGGPLQTENPYLKTHPVNDDRFAIGGIMNHRSEPTLRIDVAQHQMHSVILALKYIYK